MWCAVLADDTTQEAQVMHVHHPLAENQSTVKDSEVRQDEEVDQVMPIQTNDASDRMPTVSSLKESSDSASPHSVFTSQDHGVLQPRGSFPGSSDAEEHRGVPGHVVPGAGRHEDHVW